MQPIVCKLYNTLGESDYENGFIPDITMDENSAPARFLPFGNENELLLHTALGIIDGTWQPSTPEEESFSTILSNSVARQASPAVRIDR